MVTRKAVCATERLGDIATTIAAAIVPSAVFASTFMLFLPYEARSANYSATVPKYASSPPNVRQAVLIRYNEFDRPVIKSYDHLTIDFIGDFFGKARRFIL